MRTNFTRMDVEAAKEDIRNHTLASIKIVTRQGIRRFDSER